MLQGLEVTYQAYGLEYTRCTIIEKADLCSIPNIEQYFCVLIKKKSKFRTLTTDKAIICGKGGNM